MTPLTKILLALVITIAIAVYVVLDTKRTAFPDSTTTLLYAMGVLTPFLGLILLNITKYKYRQTS